MKLNEWFTSLTSLCRAHLAAFEDSFDAVKPTSGKYPENSWKLYGKTINGHFIVPLCIVLYISVYSLFQLLSVDFDYFVNELPNLPTHRIYPQTLWQEGDIILGVALLAAILLYSLLILDPLLPIRYQMMVEDQNGENRKLIQNGRKISSKLTGKILRFRQIARKFIRGNTVVFIVEMEVFFLVRMLISERWTNSAQDFNVLFCVVGYFVYVTFSKYRIQ